jgi:hypothetical protein
MHFELAEEALSVQLEGGNLVSINARQDETARLLDPLTVDGAPDGTVNHSLQHTGCGQSVCCICQLVSSVLKAARFTALSFEIASGDFTCG